MNNMLLIIAGMVLVTYIPRLLPFLLLSRLKLNTRAKRFLNLIPYTALGALIMPGFLTAIPESPLAAVLGLSFAIVYAWYKNSLIVSVLGSVVVAFLVTLAGNMI